MIKKFLVTSLVFTLVSCGFQVMYRDEESHASYENDLAAIRIKKDRTAIDQKLKNNLYDLLNPDSTNVEAKYFLILDVTEAVSPTFITITGASGRNKITINVSYELKNLATATTISKGTTSVNDSYNVTDNRYSTDVADEYLRNNLTKVAAQNIRNSLVNDFIEVRKECEEKKQDKEFKCQIPMEKK
jgi:hypothetical protein